MLNLLKKYSDLLDITYLSTHDRTKSLRGVFKQDIEDNNNFNFQSKLIRPIKKEGQIDMDVLFHHLTTREDKDGKGKKLGTRSFELNRSQRLHWVKSHIVTPTQKHLCIFSYQDRVDGKNKIRTYIYDTKEEYVIILEPQRSNTDYYLLTAYHLNEPGGKKQIENKMKNKLNDVY